MMKLICISAGAFLLGCIYCALYRSVPDWFALLTCIGAFFFLALQPRMPKI